MTEKEKSGLSESNIMYNLLVKNTEVMTELCKTQSAVQSTIKEISEGYIGEVVHREFLEKKVKGLIKINITILILVSIAFVIITTGDFPEWLTKLLTKLILII